MSLEVDAQLAAVQSVYRTQVQKGLEEDELAYKRLALARQWEQLEAETQEPTDSFGSLLNWVIRQRLPLKKDKAN